MIQDLQIRITAHFIFSTISRSLYGDPFACLMEIIRNGLCACMPGDSWIPGKGDISIDFYDNHPLTNRRSLIVLDRGHGFNKRSLKRISSLGPTMEDQEENPDGKFEGASQKNIGRFAAFGCMKSSGSKKPDYKKGFYILTRSTQSGPIKLISMVPAWMEERQATPIDEISLDDKRLGDFANIKGTFTAVVIPDPVFSSPDEIIEGLKWRLPRKQAQMFKLTVGGVGVKPPPLAGRVHFVSGNGDIEVHADVEPDPHSDTGIWLTDSATGFRIALASKLGRAYIPYPFCSNGLTGDIFVKDLLKMQTSSREGLHGDYLRSDEWSKVKAILFANRSSVEALLGGNKSSESPGNKEVDDLIARALSAFGPAQVIIDKFGTAVSPERTKKQGGGVTKDENPTLNNEKPLSTRKKGGGGSGQKPLRSLRLGEHDFLLDFMRLPPNRYAQTVGHRRDIDTFIVIYLNDEYGYLPTRQEARNEHVISAIVFAAACSDQKLAEDPFAARAQAAEWHAKLNAVKL